MLAPVRNLDIRRPVYRPLADGNRDSIEYRRLPMINTTDDRIAIYRIDPILLFKYPIIGQNIIWASGCTAVTQLYFLIKSSSEFSGNN